MKDCELQALEFNTNHVKGQKVKVDLNGQIIETKLISDAFALEHNACVFVEGVAGYIPINYIIE